MTPLSNRQHDAFDNDAKMACREGNLRVLREAAYRLWENAERTRLRCDWCELMGATGLRTLELLVRDSTPSPLLPERTLRAPRTLPPIVLLLPASSIPTLLARAAVPAASVPM